MKLKIFFQKMFAFIKRDFLIELSYRLEFVLSCLSIFCYVSIFFCISKLFGEWTTPYLREYGELYFPFVLIGIAFSGYLSVALRSFSTNIRNEQMLGTLEAMLITPTKPSTIILSISLWNFAFNSLSVFVYLLFGICVFKLDLTGANFFSAIIILILTILSFSGIGIISAAFIMLFKRGDPITWSTSLFFALFGGVYFPIAILPGSVRFISYLLPITYTLRALRYALLKGYGLTLLLPEILILLVFCIVLLPLSISIFKYAVRKAKVAGSLSYY